MLTMKSVQISTRHPRTTLGTVRGFLPLLVLAVSSVALNGCGTESTGETAGESDNLTASSLELRGTIQINDCVVTGGTRKAKFIVFSFDATKGQELRAVLSDFASPDLRILDASSKELA